jgi:hypothetical protein
LFFHQRTSLSPHFTAWLVLASSLRLNNRRKQSKAKERACEDAQNQQNVKVVNPHEFCNFPGAPLRSTWEKSEFMGFLHLDILLLFQAVAMGLR